jgi:hypothetical protein
MLVGQGYNVQVEIYQGLHVSVAYPPILLLEEGKRHIHRMASQQWSS